jgi:hypothetical protein
MSKLEILKDTRIGFLESVCPSSIKEINSDLFINEIEKVKAKQEPALLPHNQNKLLRDLKLNVPDTEKQERKLTWIYFSKITMFLVKIKTTYVVLLILCTQFI